jgi:glycosyltransferase involved in cell wall biosynthesis
MKAPLVSCIMPTANRHKYIPLAIKNFLNQDYQNTELVIIDDGKEPILSLLPKDERIQYFYFDQKATIGMKRNYACERANGEIIMHWDDDDWYAPDWISRSLHFLFTSEADISGVEHIHFFSPVTETFWQGTALNRNNPGYRQWLSGATMTYRKSFWEKNPFKDKQTAEDDEFVRTPGAKVFAHDYIDGFVALLHPDNTTLKYFENPAYKRKT